MLLSDQVLSSFSSYQHQKFKQPIDLLKLIQLMIPLTSVRQAGSHKFFALKLHFLRQLALPLQLQPPCQLL